MPIYEYKCCNGHVVEQQRKIDNRAESTWCPHCGEVSEFIISSPRVALDGTDASFPGAYMQWEKKRHQKMKQEKKCLENHGTER